MCPAAEDGVVQAIIKLAQATATKVAIDVEEAGTIFVNRRSPLNQEILAGGASDSDDARQTRGCRGSNAMFKGSGRSFPVTDSAAAAGFHEAVPGRARKCSKTGEISPGNSATRTVAHAAVVAVIYRRDGEVKGQELLKDQLR
jgi:hypothetical protein